MAKRGTGWVTWVPEPTEEDAEIEALGPCFACRHDNHEKCVRVGCYDCPHPNLRKHGTSMTEARDG